MRALALVVALLVAGPAAAQFPSKPIRMLVPFGAGSSTDIVTRILAEFAAYAKQQYEVWGRAIRDAGIAAE